MALRGCLILSKQILELKGVSKSYSASGGGEILALDNIFMEFNSNSLNVGVGPAGSGKSTFLRIAGLLESPSSGSVIFDSEDRTDPTLRERLNLIRHEIGIVPPYPGLLPYLTILENVMLPMNKKKTDTAVEMLKNLGVENMGSYPKQVSVEEQQKASIARAVINSPQLLLVDEPTSSLSESGAINIMELLKNLKNDFTILIFSDNMEISKYSDAVFRLNNGILE
jgi:putative ABC transport system ATP-binding protein